MRLIFVLSFFLLVGCQLAPTRIIETARPEYRELVAKMAKPIMLSEETVVLDARSSFDYGLSHVSGSIHFPWEKLAVSRTSGQLPKDVDEVAKRLAWSGLESRLPIVIVGNGKNGNGAEGRLAWSLLYYGFYDVQVASIDVFRKLMTNRPTEPLKNTSVRQIVPNENLQIGKSEIIKLLNDPSSRMGSPDRDAIFILNVDGLAEAKGFAGIQELDWKNFYNSEGRPNPKVISDLEKMGATSRHRIILISRNGVQSAAACFALISLGFSNVQNLTEGWSSISNL